MLFLNASSIYRHKLPPPKKTEINDSTNQLAAGARQKISRLRRGGGGGEGGGEGISRRGVRLAAMVNDTGIFPNLTIV